MQTIGSSSRLGPLAQTHKSGVAVLLVDQNVALSLFLAGRLESVEGTVTTISHIDQIFSVRQVLEERIRCKKQTVAVFIDFKSAFDSVHRASMWKALLAIGVPSKVVRVIAAFYDGTSCRVKVQGEKSSPFEVKSGVRQGCVLSPLLFNVVIDWIMNKSLAGRTGVACGTGLNFTDAGYADDIVFLEETEAQAQELLDTINGNAQKLGLHINARKTKCLSTDNNRVHLALRGEPIEQVEEPKY